AEKRVKDELFWAEVDDTDVVDALVDVTAVRATAERAKRDLQTLVRNVENITEPFKYTKRDLDRLMKETSERVGGGESTTVPLDNCPSPWVRREDIAAEIEAQLAAYPEDQAVEIARGED